MIYQIESETQEITEEYNTLIKVVPEFKKFSLEKYLHNKMLVISRIFFVKIHGIDDRIMVPFADMFNHHYKKIGQTFWKYDDKSDSFVVTAKHPIPSGDAVFSSYS